ncbi:uncharacterized protein FOMMEDRAFT_102212 [Fomitiporia mediterranea MF3/22]|uniref:uncharacterized protein n=1 Tax=Fomitiporia mediterranea (strain MF3/22) TaxID=694068 RepID=UPI0004409BCB|nr:uncharacterized protein FOMMEDRAFT_102212 [Fomitiporia mediterranea MF3/22]EJD06428.1 hypothetical protein FOMMEDRAFT_102212 [Fomitiporia mediterranea MF3/22]
MRKYVFLAGIVAALAWRVSKIYFAFIRPELPVEYFAGKDASSHCTILNSSDNRLASCEDGTFWDFTDAAGHLVDRKVIASCDPNRKNWNTVMGPLKDADPHGALFLVEFDEKKETVHELKFQDYPSDHDFHPLGVQVWPSKSGSPSNMFVVNHGRHSTTIEQFVLDPKDIAIAQYVRTLSSPYFVSPNALALTSPTSFFVTNDHLMTRRLPSVLGEALPLLETFLGLPLAFVSHVSISGYGADGAPAIKHTIARLGTPFPNGVALSPDGKTLAVASSSYAWVYFFNRTQNADGSESLTQSARVPVPFAPDNIHYEDDGTLLVAGHPFFPALTAIAANKTDAIAPSWIASLSPRRDGDSATRVSAFDTNAPYPASRRVSAAASHKIETIYQGDGTKFAGSTTGLRDSRTGILFVTGLYQEGLLVCRP